MTRKILIALISFRFFFAWDAKIKKFQLQGPFFCQNQKRKVHVDSYTNLVSGLELLTE